MPGFHPRCLSNKELPETSEIEPATENENLLLRCKDMLQSRTPPWVVAHFGQLPPRAAFHPLLLSQQGSTRKGVRGCGLHLVFIIVLKQHGSIRALGVGTRGASRLEG